MKNPRSILLSIAAALALLPAAAQTDAVAQTDDYEFAVRQVEENYAGYPSKVTEATRPQYEALRERLRRQVRDEARAGYEAAAELFGWFLDYHLRVETYSDPFLPPRADYDATDYAPQRLARCIDANTYLIRVPSFDSDETAWIERAVESYAASGCPYLIVDIRGNGGGRDGAYRPLLELLYDGPGRADNVELRATPEHETFLRRAIAEADGKLDWLRPVADSVAAHRGAFVPFPEDDNSLVFDTVATLPRAAAIIIDGSVASSAEQFLLDVESCSRRTTLYGRDHTLGCLDYSNIRYVTLPCSGVTCCVPMTRSCRVAEGRGIDAEGIAPDVRIPLPLPATLTDNVDEWVVWVAEKMKTETKE